MAEDHAAGESPDRKAMEGPSRFEMLIEQLSEQLRREHQHEIDGLVSQISELEARFHLREQPLPRLQGRCPPEDGANCDVGGACTAGSGEQPFAGRVSYESSADGSLADSPWAMSPDCSADGSLADSINARKRPQSPQCHRGRASIRRSTRKVLKANSLDSAKERLRRAASVPEEEAPIPNNPISAFAARIMQNHYVEVGFCVLTALSAVSMSVEAHYRSRFVAADLGFYGNKSPETWGSADDVFDALEWIFGVLFACEILLRIAGKKFRFVCSLWNWLDMALVILWFIRKMRDALPINPQLLRLTRFARLARLLRLVRRIHACDSLVLMTTSLRKSAMVLGWSGCLLLVVLVLNALVLNGFLTEFYFTNERFPLEERLEIFRYFGSFTASLFSMFELTLANWPPISRALYEHVNEWFVVVMIAHKLTIGFAVIGVINGVFMQETFKAANQDDEIMVRKTQDAYRVHTAKMRQLVDAADTSGEGLLDLEEFRNMFQDPGIRAWLASMELNPHDVDYLFTMMDDGDGVLSMDEVIRGVAMFKGTARNIDLHMMLHEQRKLQATVEHYLALSREVAI